MKAATVAGEFKIRQLGISIHAAREGGDVVVGICRRNRHVFQSTPPVKAATKFRHVIPPLYTISIHAAREGGDPNDHRKSQIRRISIHAAREGGDARRHG